MKVRLSRNVLPMLATAVVFVILYIVASTQYPSFNSVRNVMALFRSNAALGIIAVGMTLVILAEGIDLSVGAVMGLTTIFIATFIVKYHFPPWITWVLALLIGSSFGALMGFMVHTFDLPPFLVTLAGMFFARGMSYVVYKIQLTIDNSSGVYQTIQQSLNRTLWLPDLPGNGNSPPGKVFIVIQVLIFLAVLIYGIYLAQYTRFGRTTYAIGGNENSAILMGLPVARTKILIYAFSGFCAALAGVVYTFNTNGGDPALGDGFELNAIAAVVIGGTLLTGGQGYVFGTLLGVLIYGSIQTLISMNGKLDSSYQPIFIGGMLLAFILLQKFLTLGRRSSS